MAASETVYFSGQGKIYLSERDSSGNPKAFRFIGNVPALRLALETDVVEHTEARSGSRLTDFRLSRQNRARVTMTLENFNRDNLSFLMNGNIAAGGAAATVSGQSIVISSNTAPIPAGSIFFLPYKDITSVTIKDSKPSTPNSLVLNTHYSLDSASGKITTLVDLTSSLFSSSFAAPLVLTDYTIAENKIVTAFTSGVKEQTLYFEGINTANANKAVRLEIFRVIFDPVQNFDLINDELAQFEIEGTALYDAAKATDSNYGGFARVIGDSVL